MLTSNPGPLFLGVDLGTSALKLLALAANGEAVGAVEVPLALDSPQPGWAEQSPTAWWDALVAGCRELWAQGTVRPDAIVSIGLTGQMHGLVLLDRTGAALRPCLTWADARGGAEVADLEARVPAAQILAISGNRMAGSFTAAKLRWVQAHEPELYRAATMLLLPKDYLRLQLTGVRATDVSDATGTGLAALVARDWSADLVTGFGFRPDLLPPVVESTAQTGAITAEAAAATGLRAGTPVVAGGGDAPCGALAAGLLGDAATAHIGQLSIGTSAQVLGVTATPLLDSEGLINQGAYVVPGRWYGMGAILAGGVALRWLRGLLTPPGVPVPSYAVLTAEAAGVPPGAGGLLFLPYLLGERTPHHDPQARGVFFGLRLDHGRGHLVRATLEGVAFALRDALAACESAGFRLPDLRLVGGAVRGPLWATILAGVLGRPLTLSLAHGAAAGSALLAGAGVGVYIPPAPPSLPTVATRQDISHYDTLYAQYRRLYPLLQDEFADVSSELTIGEAIDQ
jgi:xylulokinase